jgi:hypothetical protein
VAALSKNKTNYNNIQAAKRAKTYCPVQESHPLSIAPTRIWAMPIISLAKFKSPL